MKTAYLTFLASLIGSVLPVSHQANGQAAGAMSAVLARNPDSLGALPARQFFFRGSLLQAQANFSTAHMSFDFEYSRAISNSFEVLYSPLPFGLRYHLPGDIAFRRSVAWNLDTEYSNGWFIRPRFSGDLRAIVTGKTDFLTSIEYSTIIPLNERPSEWGVSVSAGVEQRLSRSMSGALLVGASFKDQMKRMFLSEKEKLEQKQTTIEAVYPASASLIYRNDESTKTAFEYSYRGIGGGDRELSHIFTVWMKIAF